MLFIFTNIPILSLVIQQVLLQDVLVIVPWWNMNIVKHHPVRIVRRFKIVGEFMFTSLSSMVPQVFQGQVAAVVSVVTFISVMAVVAGGSHFSVLFVLCVKVLFCWQDAV